MPCADHDISPHLKEMAMKEVLLKYTRAELLSEYSKFYSNHSAVSRAMSDPRVQAYEEYLIEQRNKKFLEKIVKTEQKLIDAGEKAAEKLIALIDDADPRISSKVAVDILRMGALKKSKSEENAMKDKTTHLIIFDQRKQKDNEQRQVESEVDDNATEEREVEGGYFIQHSRTDT